MNYAEDQDDIDQHDEDPGITGSPDAEFPVAVGLIVMMGIALLVAFLSSCGYEPPKKEETDPVIPKATQVVIRGSVSPAFSVTVDGTTYPDMETYYGSALKQLREDADAAGYQDYEAKLNAELGFRDLTNGMAVYVQGTSTRGYQGTTTIGRDNNFRLELPEDAAGDYQIRANKRIDLQLTKDKETVLFCYNLSAKAVSVPFDEADKPVILRDFSTSLTQYACAADQPKSLEIPNAPSSDNNSDLPELLTFLEKVPFGAPYEINHVPGGELHTWKSTDLCQKDECSVLVNDAGEAFWQEGVKPELVDITAGWFATKEDALKALDDWSESK